MQTYRCICLLFLGISGIFRGFSLNVLEFFKMCTAKMNAVHQTEKTITFIRRKNYRVKKVMRSLGRILINEEEIIHSTQKIFPEYHVQEVFMETLSQRQQIILMQKTKLAIGMHGAGMVNIGFMNQGAHVIEIFPANKRRWGYRNLCRYLNFSYTEYRRGSDMGPESHKKIHLDDWRNFMTSYLIHHHTL